MEPKAAALPSIPVVEMNEGAEHIKRWHEQIDRIIYLASLASKFDDVDPMMDDLRSITATWDGKSLLEASQERRLDALEIRLRQYLIRSDPVRTFTEESLNQQLANRRHGSRLNPTTRSVIVILLASVIAPALSYLPFLPISSQNRVFLAIPLFFVALHVGISWLYLTALKNFNDEVRKAFKLVAIAAILFGVVFSQYAAIQAFHLQRFPIFQFAGITWLIVMPYIFIYLGIRMYAKQLQVQSWALKLPIAAAAGLLLIGLAALIPPVEHQDEYVAIFQNTGSICLPYFALLAAILVRKIRKVVTSVYARSMKWMYIYLIVNVVTTALANIPVSPDASGGVSLYVTMAIFGVPDQLLLLMTGYSFKKELSK